MFTGLIEEIGSIKFAGAAGEGFNLVVAAREVLEGVALGDSIAINGVCLTVTAFDASSFTVGLAPETLSRTNLGKLASGSRVNLERAALPTTRLGGHYVQGHVDGTARIKSVTPDGDAVWFAFEIEPSLMRYIVAKGYVAIDGASLTVVHTGPDFFDITMIAYSQSKLALAAKKPGDTVNIEVDILAKYVERLIAPGADDTRTPPDITSNQLSAAGFSASDRHQEGA